MPRDFARMNLAIWNDADFRALPPGAQHLYMVMWTAPDLSYCGVTEWRPGRISARAADWTTEAIDKAAYVLIDRHFLVIDLDTEEALIRSWIRWDGLMGQPIMAVSMINARGVVASNTLRAVIVHELRKLKGREPSLKGWAKSQVIDVLEQPELDAKGLPNPLANPSPNPSSKGYGLGGPNPCPNPCPTPSPTPTPLLPAKAAHCASDDARPNAPKRATDPDPDFDAWWQQYPRKRDKGHALKAYRSARKKTDAGTLLAAVTEYAASVANEDPQFLPYGATWLNGERWGDQPDPERRLRAVAGEYSGDVFNEDFDPGEPTW